MHKDEDAALVRDCKSGDRRAMSILVGQYQKPVYNAAYRILGNSDDAADATQTVFLKVFEHINDYNPKYKFFSWIYRIAINESLNQVANDVNRSLWLKARLRRGKALRKTWRRNDCATAYKTH